MCKEALQTLPKKARDDFLAIRFKLQRSSRLDLDALKLNLLSQHT